MPSARVNTATAVNPGFFRSVRIAKVMSCDSDPISLPRLFADSFDGNDDQGGVVMPVAPAEFAGGLQNNSLQIFRACIAIFFEQLEQARFTKLLTIRNVRFGNAIRKEQHAVAGCQVVGAARKLLNRKHTENAAAFEKAIVRAVAMPPDWRIVSGIGVAQPARRAVQLRVEKSDEAVRRNIAADERIQTLAQLIRSNRGGSAASKCRLQIRHQQCRRHSLAGNIANAYTQRLWAERKDVVIIAAHHARWLPGAGNFVSVQLRNFFWQKSLLNGARFGNLAVLSMKLRGDFGLRDGVGRGFLPGFAALAADLHLSLQNFEQPGIDPGLFDEVADALLHRFDGEADRGPTGHHHDRRRVFGGFQSRQ